MFAIGLQVEASAALRARGLAEGQGFEPWETLASTVFKSDSVCCVPPSPRAVRSRPRCGGAIILAVGCWAVSGTDSLVSETRSAVAVLLRGACGLWPFVAVGGRFLAEGPPYPGKRY